MLNQAEKERIESKFQETAKAVLLELGITPSPEHISSHAVAGKVSGGFLFQLRLADSWTTTPRIQLWYNNKSVTWAPDRPASVIAKAIKTKHLAAWEAYQRNNFKNRAERNSKIEAVRQNAISFAEKFGGNFCHAGSRGRHSVHFLKQEVKLNYTLRIMEHSGEISLKIENLSQEQAERALYFLHHEQNQQEGSKNERT